MTHMIRMLNGSIGRISTIAAILVASYATGRDASADSVLSLTGLTGSSFYVTTTIPGGFSTHDRVRGGNMLGSLDGVALPAIYCVDLTRTIGVPSTTATTVAHDGTIFGSVTPNAGAISWLLLNLAPAAITGEAQAALQAAIWRTEYGTHFQLDGADNGTGGNSASLISLYQADLVLLGSNTASPAGVYWLSPTDRTERVHYQGLIGAPAVPEPSSILLVSLGGLGMATLQYRRKSAEAKRST
jgi:hypothetical protein